MNPSFVADMCVSAIGLHAFMSQVSKYQSEFKRCDDAASEPYVKCFKIGAIIIMIVRLSDRNTVQRDCKLTEQGV